MKFIGRKQAPRRRLVSWAASSVVVGFAALALASPSLADPNTGCAASGQGAFTRNGSSYAWSLQAALTDCQSTVGGPSSGTLTVGQTFSESVPITLADGTVVQGTAQYSEAAGSAVLTVPSSSLCASSQVVSRPIISWDDGTTTVGFLPGGTVGPAAELQGSVAASAALGLVAGSADPAGTAPASYTVRTDNSALPVGSSLRGLLTMIADDPQTCESPGSFGSFSTSGVVEFG
jgi:hypothetical protein